MNNLTSELRAIADKFERVASPPERAAAQPQLDALRAAAMDVRKSFSGSWLGYHSRVYFDGFGTPTPGAHFSQEWGLKPSLSPRLGSKGQWREYTFDEVKAFIKTKAGSPNIDDVTKAATQARDVFATFKPEIASILDSANVNGKDRFLSDLFGKLKDLEVHSSGEFAEGWAPQGNIMTRDTTAAGQGTTVPAHISILSEVSAIEDAFTMCIELARLCRSAASHLDRSAKAVGRAAIPGTRVFIGHRRSPAWRELKDFVQDRMKLPWDEFNRVPVAGIANTSRLSEMMDNAAVAFLVMTAEDETAEGQMQARMNVIHEVGLFQGRLGFTRAIIMLEEGCAEFSNIHGLGQIRFPAGRISAAFEDVRLVLEREGLIEE